MEKPIVLSRRRVELGLTIREIADMVGVNTTTIYGWENGVTGISPFRRPKVAKAYRIPIGNLELFCDDFNRRRKNLNSVIRSIKRSPSRSSSPIEETISADIGDALQDAIGTREITLEQFSTRSGVDNQSRMRDVVRKKVIRF